MINKGVYVMDQKPTYEELEQRVRDLELRITLHQAQEGTLREGEQRFRQFVESAPVGISITRPDLTFEYFNPRFTKIFGYTLEDLPNKQVWFEKAYPDETYRKRVISIWRQDHEHLSGGSELRPDISRSGVKMGRTRPSASPR